jgi:tetratricopeptide (TPR) repeat protein
MNEFQPSDRETSPRDGLREARARLESALSSNPWSAYLLALLALGYFQFWDARHFTWLFDDYDFLAHIETFRNNPAQLFSADYDGGGRLTTVLFLFVMQALSGENQVPYHLAHLFFYILTCWVVAWSLAELGYGRILAMTAGLLYLFTVSHYSVPYWLSCFSYITCVMFGCLGIVAYVRYTIHRTSKYLIYTCIAMLLATLSHAGAIGFVALAGYFALRRGASVRVIAKSIWIPLVITSGLSYLFLLTYPGHAQNVNVAEIGSLPHIAQFTVAYLGRAFTSPFWTSTTFVAGPNTLDKLIGVLLVSGGILSFVFRRSTFTDAIAMSALTLPAFGGSTLDEYRPRYFYYADLGPALLYAQAIVGTVSWLSTGRDRWVRPAAIAGSLTLILVISHIHLKKTERMHWAVTGRNLLSMGTSSLGVQLLTRSIETVPELLPPLCYTRCALGAYQVGVNPKQILSIGVETYPDHTEIGYLYKVVSHIDAKSHVPQDLVDSVQADGATTVGSVAAILNNAGVMHYNGREDRAAERLYAAAILTHPTYFSAIVNYGNTLVLQGRMNDATITYAKAIELSPHRSGLALFGLRKIVASDRWNTTARHILAKALIATGRLNEAIKQIEAGIKVDPKNQLLIQEYANIGRILRQDAQNETAALVEERVRRLLGRP